MLCSSKYLTFWKRQEYGDSKKISGCPGPEREDEQGEHMGARAVTLFYTTPPWRVRVTQSCQNPQDDHSRTNPRASCGLHVTDGLQYVTGLVHSVDGGGGCLPECG